MSWSSTAPPATARTPPAASPGCSRSGPVAGPATSAWTRPTAPCTYPTTSTRPSRSSCSRHDLPVAAQPQPPGQLPADRPNLHGPQRLIGAQNVQIRTRPILISIEPSAVPIGGYSRAGADQPLLRTVTRFQVLRRADRRVFVRLLVALCGVSRAQIICYLPPRP